MCLPWCGPCWACFLGALTACCCSMAAEDILERNPTYGIPVSSRTVVVVQEPKEVQPSPPHTTTSTARNDLMADINKRRID